MGTEMMRRVTDREHATALRRIERANKRIANLQKRTQELKEDEQPIVEAERLLRLILTLGSLGNVRTTTIHAFTEAQFRKIVGVLK